MFVVPSACLCYAAFGSCLTCVVEPCAQPQEAFATRAHQQGKELVKLILLFDRNRVKAQISMQILCLQLKSILMAIYFAGDHVVWASQAGLHTDKQGTEKYALPHMLPTPPHLSGMLIIAVQAFCLTLLGV